MSHCLGHFKSRAAVIVRASITAVVLLSGASLRLTAQVYRAIPGTSIRAMAANAQNEVGDIATAVQLSSGSYIIGDNINDQLHFYTASGRFVRTVGRKGAGPGEFEGVTWVGECGKDSIYAFDPTLKRISIFSLDGKLARSFAPPVALISYVRCALDGTMLYVGTSGADGLVRRGAIQISDNTGKLMYRSPELLLNDGRPLGPSLKIAITSDGVAYGIGESALVTVMSARGESLKRIPAGSANRQPTDINRNAATEYAATRVKGTEYEYEHMRRLFRSLPPVKTLLAYSDLFIDNTTKVLWVKTSTFGDPALVLERRTMDGALQGTASLPAGIEIQQVRGDQLVGVLPDAKTGEQTLVTYRLVK